jgi:hypothetical protein
MAREYLSISEALRVFEAQPVCMLRQAVVILEDYISYAVEQRWSADIQELEGTVSLMKSELGRRGAFNTEEF